MKVTPPGGSAFDLGTVEASPRIGIEDYSERVTDAFGVTTVVPRGFSRTMSVRLGIPTARIDEVSRTLTALRAKAALWEADPRFAWLNVTGYFKDLSFGLPVGDLSYCTLTVDGLAETTTVADTGIDPTTNSRPSTLRFVRPAAITDATLTSSTVAETDAPAWSASATYALGANVIRGHRLYESLVAANTGADPETNTGKWVSSGPTNRWAMFDDALGTATVASAAVELVLTPATAVTAAALLDTDAASVRMQAGGYDRTVVPDAAGKALFLDLAAAAGVAITVTITPKSATPGPRRWGDTARWRDADVWQDDLAAGDGTVSIGTFLMGDLRGLGVTEADPTAGITDFSLKETDDFGEVTVVERAWAKNMAVNARIRTDAVDVVASRIAAVRAQPVLWIGDDERDSLVIYGFFRDFSIEISPNVSRLALSIEGLSKAAPIPAPAASSAPILDRGEYDPAETYFPNNIVQSAGSSWIYIASQPSSGNAPPTLPVRSNEWWRVFARAGDKGDDGTNGAAGLPGANGQSIHIAYADSADGTVNFTTGNADGRAYIGVYTDTNSGFDSPNPASYGWTLLKGQNGANGLPGPGGYVHIAYANSADGTVDFHVSDPTGRAYLGAYTDQTLADSTNPAAYAWSRSKGDRGDDGLQGSQGIPGPPGAGSASFIHLAYADSADGTVNFTTGDAGGRGYIGIYTDAVEADSTNPAMYTWSKWAGKDGTNGVPGANGQTPYTHFAYSNASDGSLDFHVSDPTGRGWLGVYSDYTVADSTNPALYTWSLIKGTNGAAGANGTPGPPGANGAATYVHIAYATSANGSTGFSTTDGAGRTYIGTYTDGILADSENPAAYTWTLIKGDDAITIEPSVASLTFEADSADVLKPGQIGKSVKFTYRKGAADLSGSTAWSLTTSGCTAAIAADGTVTFSAVATSGYVEATGVNGGVSRTQRVSIARQRDPAPPQTSAQQSQSITNVIAATVYGSVPIATVTIASNASGQINAQLVGNTYIYNYQADNVTRAWSGEFKFAYRPAGGSGWVDFAGGAFASTLARYRENSEGGAIIDQPGTVSASQTQGVASASAPYDIGLFARESGSSNGADGQVFATFTGAKP